MRCYAAIEDIDDRCRVVKCEVTCMSVEESKTVSILEINTKMAYIGLDMVEKACGNIEEGDIIVVEYICSDNTIIAVYNKADDEKQRRMEFYSKI